MSEELFEKVKAFRKEKHFWTTADVADFLAISKKKAWDLLRSGEIKAVKVNGEFRIHRDWIVEYLEKNML